MHISMGMREDLKIPLTMLSISFLNMLPFKGSYNGKRFLFKKNIVESDNKSQSVKPNLKLYVWKDLYSFENTDEKEMIIKEFDYTKEGIEQGIDFVEGISL